LYQVLQLFVEALWGIQINRLHAKIFFFLGQLFSGAISSKETIDQVKLDFHSGVGNALSLCSIDHSQSVSSNNVKD